MVWRYKAVTDFCSRFFELLIKSLRTLTGLEKIVDLTWTGLVVFWTVLCRSFSHYSRKCTCEESEKNQHCCGKPNTNSYDSTFRLKVFPVSKQNRWKALLPVDSALLTDLAGNYKRNRAETFLFTFYHRYIRKWYRPCHTIIWRSVLLAGKWENVWKTITLKFLKIPTHRRAKLLITRLLCESMKKVCFGTLRAVAIRILV